MGTVAINEKERKDPVPLTYAVLVKVSRISSSILEVAEPSSLQQKMLVLFPLKVHVGLH